MTKLSAVFAGLTMLLGATSSFAREGTWNEEHPRRAEVNQRLENQRERVTQGVREGELTRREAARLHREDRAIRARERAMASRHGGHLTRHEQRVLNRRENAVSRQIRRERELGR
jgi:hypothetical protein